MADNTQRNVTSGGDTLRDLDRLAGGIKTAVAALDQGGGSQNAESLVSLINPLLVQLNEDNVYNQELLNMIVGLLLKVFSTPGGANPALQVSCLTAANFLVTATQSGTWAQNITQIAGTTLTLITGLIAPSMNSPAFLPVAQSQSYPMPIVPMHLYDPGAIAV